MTGVPPQGPPTFDAPRTCALRTSAALDERRSFERFLRACMRIVFSLSGPLALAIGTLSCSGYSAAPPRSASAPRPATSSYASTASQDDTAMQSARATPASSTTALPVPDFGPPGPIRIGGYPTKIRSGANDPADYVGFTADGQLFGYCSTDGGLGATRCRFLDASGNAKEMSNVEEASAGNYDGPTLREIRAWLRTHGVPAVKERGLDTTGPELSGSWRYARDIELRVTSIPGEEDAAGLAVRQPALRVGGRVAGDEAVYPFMLRTNVGIGTPNVFYGVVPNGIALSPDGTELGVLADWHGMEYAGAFEMLRVSADVFAARVYNDTGFRLHQRGDFAAAQALFLKATFADPTFALAPFNLACAYARSRDPRAAAALELAIARGGSSFVERARADHDFDGVRASPWFARLVPPAR